MRTLYPSLTFWCKLQFLKNYSKTGLTAGVYSKTGLRASVYSKNRPQG